LNSRLHRLLALASVLAWLAAHPGSAQPVPGDRPGDRRPDLPDFEPVPTQPGAILPPVTPPADASVEHHPGESVYVREILLSGNTVLDPALLAALTASYTHREVSYAELLALRDRITLEYVRRGFATSGAVLPDQTVKDGVLRIEIKEGYLTAVEIQTNGRYRTRFLERRIRAAAPGPVNVQMLEQQLRLLQAEEHIASLHATLTPGEHPGESVLRLEISESRAWEFETALSNHESPSIGADNVIFDFRHTNLRGVGDEIRADYRLSDGVNALDAGYRWPLGVGGTALELRAYREDSEIVESPFDTLDIESHLATDSVTLHQPLRRAPGRSLDLFVAAEHRHSESFLLGAPFSFDAGAENGQIDLTVLRIGQEWTRSNPKQVLAARSTFSFGLNAFGATAHEQDLTDGQFQAWLAQIQWARRLGGRGFQLSARLDAQLASDALFGLEQFAVGGSTTVRGYREDLLVRDNGVVGSLEARMPVLHSNGGMPRLELAAFIDAGRAWNENESSDAQSLWSAGVGLRWRMGRWVRMELEWAEAFEQVAPTVDHDLQDDGIHYRIWSQL
jgi:hemolysin activation/secretion protein